MSLVRLGHVTRVAKSWGHFILLSAFTIAEIYRILHLLPINKTDKYAE